MKNKKIVYISILTIILTIFLIGCNSEDVEKREISYLNKSLEEVKSEFEEDEIGFKFNEEDMKNGLTKYSGRSKKGDSELILVGNKEEDRLSKAVMRGKVTPENEEVSTYTGIYFLTFLDIIGDVENGDQWLLEGMKNLIEEGAEIYEKEENGALIRLSTAEITSHLILEINPK